MMHTQKVCINHFMDQLKVCSKCKESKAHSEFNKNKSKKDGLATECKVCVKEYHKIHYENNKERRKEYYKNWYEANKEHRREITKNWREANKERSKEITKNWRGANKERVRETNKNWRGANKERVRETRREYENHRYKTDLKYRAKRILRQELKKLFKLSGLKKDKKSIELLGVSWVEAYTRLINTLPEGYTEQDWLDGKLHVDHKIPVSWYERLYGTLTEDLIKRVNHISNLQLLPVDENISKNNRYGHGINNEIILYEDWVITEQLSTVSH